MKYILKGQEPPELANWKAQANENWHPVWNVFRGDEKRATHKELLKEQGFICCYCMREIELKSSHIEHINPRSNTNEEEKLSYNNMLASCDGDEGADKRKHYHCGHFRGTTGKNWYDSKQFISPLDSDCETRFDFFDDGIMSAVENDSGTQKTVDTLGLNCSLLVKNRREAIWAVIDDCSTDELNLIYDNYCNPDDDERYRKYCVAVRQAVSQLI
jgi:uncharacterized protein (TIGR02646 family)